MSLGREMFDLCFEFISIDSKEGCLMLSHELDLAIEIERVPSLLNGVTVYVNDVQPTIPGVSLEEEN